MSALYVMAGGGTGGHLYPGIAVADALRRRDPALEIVFFTTQRSLDATLLDPRGYRRVEQPVRPFTVHPLRVAGFLASWRASVQAARRWLRENDVHAVLGLGGYAAGPPVVAAHRLGIPTAILNPDAVPGRANRHLARYARRVVLQWADSRALFPARTVCEVLGCPIRTGFAEASASDARRHFGLDPERPVLLVTGASQGASTVNDVLPVIWREFRANHDHWQMLHLSGTQHEERVRAAYGDVAAGDVRVVGFTEEMPLALAAADAVISRAGASTLAELTAAGVPSVLLPYPYHRDRHQHRNAEVLVRAGAAELIEDQRDARTTAAPLLAALERLADAGVRAEMAAAAKKLGRPNAAEAVAERLAAGLAGNVR